jgi:hypothetical protein
LGCGQGGIHKTIFWVCGWISEEVCKIPSVRTHNARIEKASIKIDTQKRNDQLLSLEPEKSSLESMHPKYTKVFELNEYKAFYRIKMQVVSKTRLAYLLRTKINDL